MTANREKAREVAFEALQTAEPEARDGLAREALTMDEGCPEAYIALATLKEPTEARELLERAVLNAGERLGEGALQRHRGELWELEGADTYFQARDQLVRCLSALGDEKGCIENLEEMLSLAGEDRLNFSHPLLGYYVNDGQDQKAARLMQEHPCNCTQHYYTQALLTFRLFGPTDDRSNYQLERALEAYPHVPAYLLGLRSLPSSPPCVMDADDYESQAAAYAVAQSYSWYSTPGATQWLEATAGDLVAEDLGELGEDDPGEARLFCWREPAGESPALASYKAALEALLDSYATEMDLDTDRHAVWQGFTYFTVSGDAWDIAELAVMLLEDNVSDFHVHVDTELALEVFDSFGVDGVSVQRVGS